MWTVVLSWGIFTAAVLLDLDVVSDVLVASGVVFLSDVLVVSDVVFVSDVLVVSGVVFLSDVLVVSLVVDFLLLSSVCESSSDFLNCCLEIEPSL